MFRNIDWKWLIIGILIAMFVLPRVLGAVSKRKAGN